MIFPASNPLPALGPVKTLEEPPEIFRGQGVIGPVLQNPQGCAHGLGEVPRMRELRAGQKPALWPLSKRPSRLQRPAVWAMESSPARAEKPGGNPDPPRIRMSWVETTRQVCPLCRRALIRSIMSLRCCRTSGLKDVRPLPAPAGPEQLPGLFAGVDHGQDLFGPVHLPGQLGPSRGSLKSLGSSTRVRFSRSCSDSGNP